jgi:hypothetical protein
MAEYVVYPGGVAASTLSRAKAIARKMAKEYGPPAWVENLKTEKTVYRVSNPSSSNPSRVTARKTKGGIIVSVKVATLSAARKLAKKMGVRS